MDGNISRRQLLRALVGTLGLAGVCRALGVPFENGMAQGRDEQVHFPMVARTGADDGTPTPTPPQRLTPAPEPTATVPAPPSGSSVVHVHGEGATAWDFGDDYYGDFVDQDVVDEMVDQGVTALTDASSAAEAWQALVPDYSPGKAIAIKVNFNNNWVCQPTHVNLNNVIHPINAVVRGLKLAFPFFDEKDVWVYEACQSWQTRQLSERFVAGCLYPGVRFFDYSCHEPARYDNDDPTALITWNNLPGIADPPETRLTDVLVNATYLIDMPIIKRHWATGITGALKNHYGSLANAMGLHDWTYPTGDNYGGTDWNPIVDVNLNTHIADKTVLILMDALYGNWVCNNSKPEPWTTFGDGAPDSILLAADPVAVDSVMCDLLDAEKQVDSFSDDCLAYADSVGLGTYERGDPWGDGYSLIDYLYLPL